MNDDPKWKVYEKVIADLKESYEDCIVDYDCKVEGRRSGEMRQVDILLSDTLAGHRVTVAVECRCYEKEPVGIKDIEALIGFLDDVGANKGVLVSNSGFTKGAVNRARASDIELQTITLDEVDTFDWSGYMHGDCQSFAGCWGVVGWEEYLCEERGDIAPPPYKVGYCSHCGTFHIECGNCGELDFYEEDSIIQCSACDTQWELDFDNGILVKIRQINNLDE